MKIPQRGIDYTGTLTGTKHIHKVIGYIGGNKWSVQCVKCNATRAIWSSAMVKGAVRCLTCEPVQKNNQASRDIMVLMLNNGSTIPVIARKLNINVSLAHVMKRILIEENSTLTVKLNERVLMTTVAPAMTFDEIGEVIGMTRQGVEKVLKKAMKKLDVLLRDRELEEYIYIDPEVNRYIEPSTSRHYSIAT